MAGVRVVGVRQIDEGEYREANAAVRTLDELTFKDKMREEYSASSFSAFGRRMSAIPLVGRPEPGM